jgi:hypothetical protein
VGEGKARLPEEEGKSAIGGFVVKTSPPITHQTVKYCSIPESTPQEAKRPAEILGRFSSG